MAHVAQRLAWRRYAENAHFIGYTLIGLHLGVEESELTLPSCCRRRVRVLHDAGQRAVGHHEPAGAASFELMCQQSEGIGVTLEVRDVIPERCRHPLPQVVALTLGEESLYSLLAGVPEGWVAQVVSQAGRGHYLPQFSN